MFYVFVGSFMLNDVGFDEFRLLGNVIRIITRY